MLSPLSKIGGEVIDTSTEPLTQGLLHLNLIFDQVPDKDIIEQFGEALNRFMWTSKMPVNRVVWGGLTSWGGSHLSPGAHTQTLKAVKLLKAGVGKGSERKRQKLEKARIVPFPASSTMAQETLFSSPTTDPRQYSLCQETEELTHAEKVRCFGIGSTSLKSVWCSHRLSIGMAFGACIVMVMKATQGA